MPKTKCNVLKPLYYDRFRCIMGACEYDCCSRSWSITVDKDTYIKYTNSSNPQFREKANKVIKRLTDEPAGDRNYAEFICGEDKRCPFLTPEGLCEIHKELGEGSLCITCKTYPRRTRRMIPDYTEMSLAMSCPEAVRIALFDRNQIEFTADTVEFDQNNPNCTVNRQPMEGSIKTQYLQYAWAMREAAITIMQKRSCPVAYRIIIIAMMLSEVTQAHDSGKAYDIPEILRFFSTGTYGAQFCDEFDSIEQNETIKMKMSVLPYALLKALKDAQFSVINEFAERFEKHSEPVFNNLAGANILNSGTDEGHNIAKFYFFTDRHIKAHWSDFINRWEYVLENYFVSYIFADLFPVTYHREGLSPYVHSVILAEQYSLLKILLCVNYDDNEGFSEKYIVQMISQATVLHQHTGAPLDIIEKYKAAGIDTPAHLYYLLM